MEITDSIESKQAEQQLQFLSSITEKVLDAIIVTDTNYRITYVNDAAQNLFGYSKEELIGNTPAILNTEPVSAEIQENIYSIVSKGGVWFGTVLNRKKDGGTFICECKVAPHYDDNGQIIAYIGIQRNITERKQEEQKHQAIIQTATDGFWMTNLQGRFLEVNDSFCEMIGYSRKELPEMSISDIEAIESTEDTIRHIQQLKKQGYLRFESKHRCKDGRIIDVEISSNYLDTGEGQIFTFVRDITKRKEAERDQLESEEKYRDLYDNAPAAYYSVGNDGFIKESNKAVQDWLGYSAEEFNSMQVFNIYAEESKPKAELLFKRFQNGKSIENEEMVYIRKDKQKVYGLISVNPIVDSDGKVVVSRSVVRDITERKKLEDELMQYQNHLEEIVEKRTDELTKINKKLERLYQREKELRGQIEEGARHRIDFIRTLIHEIKTPFTPMIGASDMLVNSLEDEKLLRIARNINRSAHNLNNRINDLMDLITGEAGLMRLEYHNIDPFHLLSETVEDMTPEANRKKQLLTLNICSPLPKIYADSDRLRQVLLNLVNNALKFTLEGGEITVSAQANNENFIISVADTGCGIDEEDQQLLFEQRELFKSGRIKPPGLGLGLPLSKMLVELHSGKIWVNSKKGSGSTFSFSIPIKASS
ncbi:PAS domain S-box protein [Chloroflexota bacterium]